MEHESLNEVQIKWQRLQVAEKQTAFERQNAANDRGSEDPKRPSNCASGHASHALPNPSKPHLRLGRGEGVFE